MASANPGRFTPRTPVTFAAQRMRQLPMPIPKAAGKLFAKTLRALKPGLKSLGVRKHELPATHHVEPASECDTTCAVCLSGCEDSETRMACCDAPIHAACLKQWIDTALDTRCPYCRQEIELPEDVTKALHVRRQARREQDNEDQSRTLRQRQETAQQIFDVFSVTHRVQLDADVVWSWAQTAPLKPIPRMLQDFEQWYLERSEDEA